MESEGVVSEGERSVNGWGGGGSEDVGNGSSTD